MEGDGVMLWFLCCSLICLYVFIRFQLLNFTEKITKLTGINFKNLHLQKSKSSYGEW